MIRTFPAFFGLHSLPEVSLPGGDRHLQTDLARQPRVLGPQRLRGPLLLQAGTYFLLAAGGKNTRV